MSRHPRDKEKSSPSGAVRMMTGNWHQKIFISWLGKKKKKKEDLTCQHSPMDGFAKNSALNQHTHPRHPSSQTGRTYWMRNWLSVRRAMWVHGFAGLQSRGPESQFCPRISHYKHLGSRARMFRLRPTPWISSSD